MTTHPAGYEPRPVYWARRVARLLFKSQAAQEIGPTAVLLVLHVVHIEDSLDYRGPVTFWNEHLMTSAGIRDKHAFSTARSKAIEAGWLNYVAPPSGSKTTPGKYWTSIPEIWRDADDRDSDSGCETIEHAYQRGFFDGANSNNTNHLSMSVKPSWSNEHVGQTTLETTLETTQETTQETTNIPTNTNTNISLLEKQAKEERQPVIDSVNPSTTTDATSETVPTSQEQERFKLDTKSKPSRKKATAANPPSIPTELDTQEFRAALSDFVAHLTSRNRKRLTPQAIAELVLTMVPWGSNIAIQQMRKSIRCNYADVYPPGDKPTTKGTNNDRAKSNKPVFPVERHTPGQPQDTSFSKRQSATNQP